MIKPLSLLICLLYTEIGLLYSSETRITFLKEDEKHCEQKLRKRTTIIMKSVVSSPWRSSKGLGGRYKAMEISCGPIGCCLTSRLTSSMSVSMPRSQCQCLSTDKKTRL